MRKRMKNKYDEDFPSDHAYEIPDFLPPPSELAKAKQIVTVTIGLDLDTINFFKEQAAKRGKKYQRMIREVLDRYTDYYRPKKSA